MKYLRRLFAVTVLAALFVVPAFAGETPCPGIASPQQSATAVDPMTEVALNLLQSVLSLF